MCNGFQVRRKNQDHNRPRSGAMSDRRPVWRGLPQGKARPKSAAVKTSTVVPMHWNPAGDERAQEAALRAKDRAQKATALQSNCLQTSSANCLHDRSIAKLSAEKQLSAKEESSHQAATAARAVAVAREEVKKKQYAMALAAREYASKAAIATRAEPLELARASLAASERCCRRSVSQHPKLSEITRNIPSENGRQLLTALEVNENDAANTQLRNALVGHRNRPKSGGFRLNAPVLRTRPETSRARSQGGQSLSSSDAGPFLGIGFASALGAEEEALPPRWAHVEPPPREERASVCEVGDVDDTHLQGLQAELERIRQLEALLESANHTRGV